MCKAVAMAKEEHPTIKLMDSNNRIVWRKGQAQRWLGIAFSRPQLTPEQ